MSAWLVTLSLLAGQGATGDKPQRILQLGHTEAVTAVDVFQRGKERLALTGGSDGAVNLWNADNGTLLSTWTWPDRRWPSHIFADKGGKHAVLLPAGGQSFRLDLDSGVFTKIPLLAPNQATTTDLISVSVGVADTGAGIAEVRLCHPGRLVENSREGFGRGTTHRRSFDVLLEPGPNRLEARALSDGRVESVSRAVEVVHGQAVSTVRLRILSVGINDYRDTSLKLKYVKVDAEALVKALKEKGKRRSKGGIKGHLVTDKQATQKGVRNGFDWLSRSTRPEDVVVVYLAGHGETVGDQYYLIPQNLNFTGLDAVKKSGISQTELQDIIRRLPAQKVLVLLDTCKSDAVSLSFASRGLTEKQAMSVLGQATGVSLVAASTSRQLALEDADIDKDVAVTVGELNTSLEAEVARVSHETFQQEQFPVTHGVARNFPLGLVR